MRMWMVNPRVMCRQHLLGEHVEHHMFVGSINKGLAMTGYIEKNLLEPMSLSDRHAALVEEMERRGYNHKSPLPPADIDYLPFSEKFAKVDIQSAQEDLRSRCPECAALMTEEENRLA